MRECLLDQIRAQNDQFSSRRVFLQAICVALLFTASMLSRRILIGPSSAKFFLSCIFCVEELTQKLTT